MPTSCTSRSSGTRPPVPRGWDGLGEPREPNQGLQTRSPQRPSDEIGSRPETLLETRKPASRASAPIRGGHILGCPAMHCPLGQLLLEEAPLAQLAEVGGHLPESAGGELKLTAGRSPVHFKTEA